MLNHLLRHRQRARRGCRGSAAEPIAARRRTVCYRFQEWRSGCVRIQIKRRRAKEGDGRPHAEQLTPLLDGLQLAVERIKQARNSRKLIFVVSDGNAHSRIYTRDEVDNLVSATDAPIYSISRNFAGISDLAPGEGEARAILDELARRSGGRHFMIDSTTEIRDLAIRIAVDFRTSYVIGFQGRDTGPSYRQIEVRIMRPELQFLAARHRLAYTLQK